MMKPDFKWNKERCDAFILCKQACRCYGATSFLKALFKSSACGNLFHFSKEQRGGKCQERTSIERERHGKQHFSYLPQWSSGLSGTFFKIQLPARSHASQNEILLKAFLNLALGNETHRLNWCFWDLLSFFKHTYPSSSSMHHSFF